MIKQDNLEPAAENQGRTLPGAWSVVGTSVTAICCCINFLTSKIFANERPYISKCPSATVYSCLPPSLLALTQGSL